MEEEDGRAPSGQALVNQAASHLGPSGFDPSREGLEHVAKALWLQAASFKDKEAYWLTKSENDRQTYVSGALAAIAALRELARMGHGSWCFHAARRAQVSKQEVVWALGGKDIHLGDDEIFAACLDAILASDTDGSPEGTDRNGLDGEAATAGAAESGIAPEPSP